MLTLAWDELRRAARRLRRQPALALAVSATLGIGLAANTLVFGLVNALLLRPLPGITTFGTLYNVHRQTPETPFDAFSYPDYRDLRERTAGRMTLAAFTGLPMSLGNAPAELIVGQLVSGNYFRALGTQPLLGRLLDESDERPGALDAIVLSEPLWRRRFGADPKVVGSSMLLNGSPFTVVGIGPEGFSGHFVGFASDAWVSVLSAPRAAPGRSLEGRERPWLELIAQGRGPQGALEARLEAEDAALARGLGRERTRTAIHARLTTGIDDDLVRGVRVFLSLLQGLALLVLLVTCANVAGLLLARGHARGPERAVRIALGAGSRHLALDALSEGLLMSLAGAVLALVLCSWASDLWLAFQPGLSLPLRVDLSPDLRVLGFLLASWLACGALIGLVPLLAARRSALPSQLAESGRGVVRTPLRRALLAAQVAAALVLLAGASLLLRSLDAVRRAEPGFTIDGVHTARIDIGMLPRSEEEARVFSRALLERAGGLPGVEAIALARSVPLRLGFGGLPSAKIRLPGQPATEAATTASLNVVSPGFFATLRIPVLGGRDFDASDRQGGQGVAILGDGLARRLFGGDSALGQSVEVDGVPRRVVGVVREVRNRSVAEAGDPQLYLPHEQSPARRFTLLVRGGSPAAVVADQVRRAVAALEPGLPLLDNLSLREVLGLSLLPQRMAASVAAAAGLVGLALVAVGLHGLVAFAVSRRTREIGIRLALGATPRRVLRLMLAESMIPAAVGIAAGAPLALGFGQLLATALRGVAATDSIALAASVLSVSAVALAASWAPARRAARLDAAIALREE